MSISEISSNQLGTDQRSLQLDKTLIEENNVDNLLGKSSVGLINFETDETTSKIVDRALVIRSRLTNVGPAKRKSKSTEW